MKIQGPGKTSGPRGAAKAGAKGSASSAAFDGLLGEADEVEGQKPVSGASGIAGISALLSLQEAGDGTSEEAAKKSKRRAAALLDLLDNVRMGLLTGGIPKTSLQHLTSLVSQHREQVMDPQLAEILDEIDLRAQVELAKHGR
jgi:hypothetical protein